MKKNYNLTIIFFLLFSFTVQSQSILLVNDNKKNPERVEPLKTSLETLGYPYTFFNTVETQAAPTAEYLEPYDLVIWYTGNDGADLFFWNTNDSDNEALKTYLDQGGMMWLQGLDFLYDKYKGAPDTFQVGDFVYDYLGISNYLAQSKVDDGVVSTGVPFYEVNPDNGIFTLDTIKWSFSTLWYADALLPVDDATVLYKMGPADYDLGGMASAIYYEKGDAKVMTFSTESGKSDAQWRLDTLFSQGLKYFSQFASTTINVESITLTSEGNVNNIDTKFGTLQFSATVLPDDATNKNIVWRLENNTAYASIDQNGLLSSKGLSYGNGEVTVVAEAGDGSGVVGTMDITITNQGDANDFEVLLVNDNANGKKRYLELDTALINLGKNYTIYNTITTAQFPGADFMNNFDVVIWYTGNDGDGLKLWDVSDTLNYKFNAPLISYIDNGGFVWLNGLDFFYDLFKKAPFPKAETDFFQEGQFIYDYMGITKYVAQSKSDDGDQGVPQLDVVDDNGICELTPIEWSFSTMWFVDALLINDNAQGIYKFGPADYVFAPLPFYATVFNQHNSGRLLTSTFEAARLDDQDNLYQLMSEILDYFEASVGVSSIEGYVNDINLYPNPSLEQTSFSYVLEKKSDVNLSIFSITGNLVYQNKLDNQSIGAHNIQIDTKSFNAGMYLCTFDVDGKQLTKKLIVSK